METYLHQARMHRPLFAVVCCIRSTPSQLALPSTSLFRTLLPSMDRSITQLERRQWTVRLYLCADDDDELFKSHEAAIVAAAPMERITPRSARRRSISGWSNSLWDEPDRSAAAFASW